jgi:hypothetical protein
MSVVFLTVFSGVLTYTLGALILKLVIEPVQDLKKTIGVISHSLIERANVYSNPGIGTKDVADETSRELRKWRLSFSPTYSLSLAIPGRRAYSDFP